MSPRRFREWHPDSTFEWFEFDKEPSEIEQKAALKAIARAIEAENTQIKAPSWSGLTSPEPNHGHAHRWGLSTPTRQPPVPGWLRTPPGKERPG